MIGLGLLRMLRRSRTVRPLLWWVLAVLAYVVFPLPQQWVLLLVVGLGVALTVTFMRLRAGGHQVRERAAWGWEVAERLVGAVEARIRGDHEQPIQGYQGGHRYGYVQQPLPTYGHLGGLATAYDPGALLSAVVAVLAAEGLSTDATPALPAVAQLLADQGIQPQPGIPAPTALGLVEALQLAARRAHRAMPPALLASVIRAVLVQDKVLPQQISIDDADILITDSATILHALYIRPDDDAGSLHDWPLVAQIVDSAPLPAPY